VLLREGRGNRGITNEGVKLILGKGMRLRKSVLPFLFLASQIGFD